MATSVPETNAAEMPPIDIAINTTQNESERMMTGITGSPINEPETRLHLRRPTFRVGRDR